jgi:hypothetical protein
LRAASFGLAALALLTADHNLDRPWRAQDLDCNRYRRAIQVGTSDVRNTARRSVHGSESALEDGLVQAADDDPNLAVYRRLRDLFLDGVHGELIRKWIAPKADLRGAGHFASIACLHGAISSACDARSVACTELFPEWDLDT